MSIKSTQEVTREYALSVLLEEIPEISNYTLGILLDDLANSKESRSLSYFENFIVKN